MRTHHLFISHSWSYSDSYEKLIHLLQSRPYFKFKDYSVPRHDPVHDAGTDAELLSAIQNQMSPCAVVLILAGVYATHSKWINKEIRLAQRGFVQPKPIVAIEPWGSKKTSTTVKAAADRTVRWNTDSIVKAIREVA